MAFYTLGIHLGHDRGVALLEDGQLVCNLAQERIDRVKHSNSPEVPREALAAVLEYAGIAREDIGAIGVSYTNVDIRAIVQEIAAELAAVDGLRNAKVIGVSHHDAHAFSTYYTSDFRDALIFIADGAGDNVGHQIEAESLYLADEADFRLLSRRLQDHGFFYLTRRNSYRYSYMHETDRAKQISLGRKYEQLTYLIGFKHGEAGKTMGLAAYGKPLLDFSPHDYTELGFSLTYGDILRELELQRQRDSLPVHEWIIKHREDIAATAQRFIEVSVLELLKSTAARYGTRKLCLGGGLFLNCQLNHAILDQGIFDEIYVVPAAGDDGQAIGAAHGAHARVCGPPRPSSAPLPFLGPSYTTRQIAGTLGHFQLPACRFSDLQLAQRLVSLLRQGKVIGLLRGRSETGPRALCHRSILADPTFPWMKDHLNESIKFRESFRPFAPVVIAERELDYFDLKQPSPYMLLAAPVRAPYRNSLPAITHIDGTARVQSVTAHEEPFVHMLLREFEKASGHPVLLNTSFNLAGEPIVETPHDAVTTFLRSDLDALVIEDHLVERPISK